MAINCKLGGVVDELDKTLTLMTIESLEESGMFYHLLHAITKLESTIMKIDCFLNYGWITEEQAENLTDDINGLIERINNLIVVII